MDSVMRHFGLKKAVSGFLLVFRFSSQYFGHMAIRLSGFLDLEIPNCSVSFQSLFVSIALNIITETRHH